MQAIFLDIETTGLDPNKHRAIDVAFQVIDLTTGKRKGVYQSIVKQPQEVWDRCDPISLGINGFTWEQVCTGKDPATISHEIIQLLTHLKIERGQSVFICQNPAFDRGFFTQLVDVYTQEKLNWPYHWLDFASMYWALLTKKNKSIQSPFPDRLNLSKNEIAKTFALPEEKQPHRAMQGVEHLMMCYQAVLDVNFEKN